MVTQPYTPDVRAFFKIDPLAVGAVLRFKLKAQGQRIMIGDELERVRLAQMLEELEDQLMADAWVDFPDVDHACIHRGTR